MPWRSMTFWYYVYSDFNLVQVDRSYHKTSYKTETDGSTYMVGDNQIKEITASPKRVFVINGKWSVYLVAV